MLSTVLLGDITKHQYDPDNLVRCIADRCSAVGNLVFPPVTREQRSVVGQAHHLTALHHLLHRVKRRQAGLGADDAKHVGQGLTQRIGQRPTGETLGGRVHSGDQTRNIGGNNGVTNRIERDGEVLLAFLQRLFTLPPGQQNAVEACHQLADLARVRELQRLRHLLCVGQSRHGRCCFHHGCEFAP